MKEELNKLQEIADLLPSECLLLLDMKSTHKHWLVNYEYYYVPNNLSKETLKNTVDLGHFNEKHRTPHESLEEDIKHSIQKHWGNKLEIGDIKLMAWSSKTVEQDTGLCYIYNKSGKCLGIYCHCRNRIEEYIHVGKSIEQFFDLEQTLEIAKKHTTDTHLPAVKINVSKQRTKTYDQCLKIDEYKIYDSELGEKISLNLYKKLIDEEFIPLSNNDLEYSSLDLIKNSNELTFTWDINGLSIDIDLMNDSDYIDFKIYKAMNFILIMTGSAKEFVLFKDHRFGQEYGVAYIDKKKANTLSKLFTLEIIEL